MCHCTQAKQLLVAPSAHPAGQKKIFAIVAPEEDLSALAADRTPRSTRLERMEHLAAELDRQTASQQQVLTMI
jgi:hypothetical protein